MIGREQLRCVHCLALVDQAVAQLLADEIPNMPNPPHDPDGHWLAELFAGSEYAASDPQFTLQGGTVVVCRRCVRKVRQPKEAPAFSA